MSDQQNKIAVLLFIVLGLLIVAFADAQVIPQYTPEEHTSGRAQAEIHERQMQEYQRVIEEQRRIEQPPPAVYPHDYNNPPRYDERLWKSR